MASSVRVQRVDREKSRSYYVNLPAVLADAIDLKKGERFIWSLEDKNTLVFTRAQKHPPRRLKSRPN